VTECAAGFLLSITYTVPVSSGLIAGESLMGVAIILTLEIMKVGGLWAGCRNRLPCVSAYADRWSSVTREGFQEVFHRKARLRNDLSQGTDTDLLVVRHDDSACRLGTAQDHVASFLPAKRELTSLERRPHILATQIRWQLWHVGSRSRGLDLDKLSSGFRRNWVARFSAVLQVQFNRLTNISQCLFAGISLADASGKRRN